jgi:hypothetical protein
MTLHLRSLAAVLLLTALGAACGNDPVTIPTTTAALTTEVYSGSVAVRSTGFYSFTGAAAGPVAITLASLTDANGRTLSNRLLLGFGVPAGEGCSVTTSVTTRPGLSAQLSAPAAASTYCVQLSDAGELTAPANFGVRIVHP